MALATYKPFCYIFKLKLFSVILALSFDIGENLIHLIYLFLVNIIAILYFYYITVCRVNLFFADTMKTELIKRLCQLRKKKVKQLLINEEFKVELTSCI